MNQVCHCLRPFAFIFRTSSTNFFGLPGMRRLNHNIDISNGTGAGTELELDQLEPHAWTDPETSHPRIENAPNSHHLGQTRIQHSPDVEPGRPSVIKDY